MSVTWIIFSERLSRRSSYRLLVAKTQFDKTAREAHGWICGAHRTDRMYRCGDIKMRLTGGKNERELYICICSVWTTLSCKDPVAQVLKQIQKSSESEQPGLSFKSYEQKEQVIPI